MMFDERTLGLELNDKTTAEDLRQLVAQLDILRVPDDTSIELQTELLGAAPRRLVIVVDTESTES